jgi:N-acetylglucosamine-6-phosphate deacetylase
MAITNGRVLTARGDVEALDLLVSEGLIVEIAPALSATTELDAQGGFVLPGIINLHVHGLGHESPSADTLFRMGELAAQSGNTAFCLTLLSSPEEMQEQMRRHRETTDEFRLLPQCLGFRLEGPYLFHSGGGPAEAVLPVDPALTQALLEAGGEHIRIWDISPELPGTRDLIAELTARGVVCSLAHSSCSIQQAQEAVEAGLSLVTHMFDAFELPTMTDPGVYPAGLMDYLLVDDRVTAEIIPDGTHVHPLLVEKTLRCKSSTGVIFVTDSNVGAGLPPGQYDLPWAEGLIDIVDENSGARVDGMLAGSALTPLGMLRNAVTMFGCGLSRAWELCSRNPARLLGLNKGEIAPGRDADLIVLDEELNLLYTVVAGEVVHRAD